MTPPWIGLTSARDLARTGGHHGAQLRAEYNIGIMRYYAGDIAGALDQLPRAVALAERKGLTWSPYGVEARAVSVIALYVAGQWDGAWRPLRWPVPVRRT